MNIPGLKEATAKLVSDNASTILTAGGVIGTCITAALAAKAGSRAALKIDMETRERTAMAVYHAPDDEKHLVPEIILSKKEKLAIAWPLFVPPLLLGAATIASIVWANQISAKRAAAMAALYGVSQDRIQEYRSKLEEKLSGPKFAEAEQEIKQGQIEKTPPREVIIIGNGDVLCFDEYTGRYFRSSHDAIIRAQNKVNDDLFQVQYASLSSFYDYIGLMPTSFSNEVGWNLATTGSMEVRITAVKSPQTNEPCLSVDFVVPPRPEYRQNY
jgi:uncharacterized protein DUF6353